VSASELDVTGLWLGAYSYRRSLTTVTFEASLDEALGAIGGAIEEMARRQRPPRLLTATLHGRRENRRVAWIKRYDEPKPLGYEHPVAYEGTLSSDGTEIRGEWRLPGAQTGTFLMIRARALDAEMQREAEAALKR
jgi:hypothetical protein